MKTYKRRVYDQIILDALESGGAVLVEGAKWCGKTTTCEQTAKSAFYIDEIGKRDANILLARTNPTRILNGDTPRLIDEWQLAPSLWDDIRLKVDHEDETGAYLLTGSSVPPNMEEIRHSGAGRFSFVKMRPMSLWESEESSGSVSIKDLLAGKKPAGEESKSGNLEEIAFELCRGGWPYACKLKGKAALSRACAYLDAVVRSDISRVDGVNRDEQRARRLMRSYARLQGSQAVANVIKADMAANEQQTFGEATVCSYLNALRKIFVVEDMPAWCPNLRTKAILRTGDTRYFTDPSIAVAAMGIGPDDLFNDMQTFGLLFETMSVRDLRIYADALDGSVSHYLDASGLECDAVLHTRNGKYGLIEIKIGGKELIEKGVGTLNKLAERIDTSKMKEPAFKMILTAVGDFAYTREDGIIVCPLGCLKP